MYKNSCDVYRSTSEFKTYISNVSFLHGIQCNKNEQKLGQSTLLMITYDADLQVTYLVNCERKSVLVNEVMTLIMH